MADLTPYVPRFLLEWEQRFGDTRHQAVDGTLVFADVSGFTRLSERLARAGGKVGAEQMTDVINALFGDLLMVAARRGGEMLKYGGDALLLLFLGDEHASRAAAACHDMQARLREIGRVETGAGPVRLRMSVGVHTGTFDMFRVGASHAELVVAGPAATTTCAMETAADAGEILLSPTTVAQLRPGVLGAAKTDGRLLRRCPDAPFVVTAPVPQQEGVERFLSPAIASYLSQGIVDPDHRLATIAFLHLIGIDDRLAAGQPASEVADALHDTLSTIQEALADLGVTFLATDVIGNGAKVMASAGAPVAVEAAGDRMVRALVRIRDARTPLPVRAGTHQGHVFAGDVGPSFRRTFTTIGDVTNTAARVMGQAKPGEVLALRSVLDHVPSCTAEAQPPFLAKGKTEPLVPYLVERIAKAGDETATAGILTTQLPFIGRDDQLRALQATIAEAAQGTGGAVEVVGDAGVGKSRLVQELVASGFRRVVVRCEPYELRTPYFAIRHVLHPVFGVVADAEQLRQRLDELDPVLAPWLPLLGAIFDVPVAATPETEALDGRYRRHRTSQLVAEVLARGVEGPLLLVVEDTHWLDDASGAVVEHLAAVARQHPWVLVATRRPEPASFEATASLPLSPLDESATAALIARATESTPLPPRRIADLVERSGGNPLFLQGLLGTDDAELPSSIEAIVAARIDALPADARRFLRTAAVLGSSFQERLVLEVDRTLKRTSPDVRAARAQLDDFIVREESGRIRFRHQLVRDVAYASLPYRERRRLHQLAGETIERMGDDLDGSLAVLSLHFAESGQHRKAWRYGVKAAKRATEKFASADAVGLFRRALAAAESVPSIPLRQRSDVWELLGDAANLASDREEALRAYREARRLRRDSDSIGYARACRKEARILERQGSTSAAVRRIGEAERALGDNTSTKAIGERATLWALRAWMRRQAGRPDQAVRWAERAIDAGRQSTSRACRQATASAYVILDGAEVALGRPSRATHATKALRIYESLNSLADQAVVLNNLGAHAYHRGNWDDAVRLFGRSRESNVRVGNHLDAGYGSWNIAEILMDQGRVEEAAAELQALSSLWRSVGFALGDALVDWQRGRIEARWGDPARGLELLRPVRGRLEAVGVTAYVIGVDTAIAECLLRLGDVPAASALVEQTLVRDAAAGGTPGLPSLYRLRGYGAASEGRVVDAWASFEESLHQARTRQSPFDVALALEGFAVLSALGAASYDGVDDRDGVLRELGVIASPPPPLLSAASAS